MLALSTLFVPLGVLIIGLVDTPQTVSAAPSEYLNFQARLRTSGGSIVPNGNYNIQFKLYDASSGGNLLWTETRTGADVVRVVNGYLSVNLGSVTAFPSDLNWSQQHWLTMNIGGIGEPDWDGEMNPRLLLTAVPYAFQADKANTARNVASDATNSASTNSGSITIQSGNATGSTSNSGNITIDAGTATGTAGSISLGATNASSLILGRSGLTTQVQGSLSVAQNFTVDTNTLFVDASTNRVGLGTLSPQATLHVDGTVRLEDFANCTALETDADGDLVCGNDDTGTSLLTDGGTFTYLTSTSDDFVLGANSTAGATLYHDVSAGSLRLGNDSLAGSLGLSDGSANYLTIDVDSLEGNYTLTVPTITEDDEICLLNLGNCSSGGGISPNLTDNVTDALDIQQGTNNYFNIDTTDDEESISFGNTTTNPDFNFYGSGNMRIESSSVTLQSQANSTSALSIQNTDGINLLNVDSENRIITVGANSIGNWDNTELVNMDLPAGNGRGVSFSPDGQYVSVVHTTSPYITIYRRYGDQYAKLPNPSNLPAGIGFGVSFSPDGQYMSVAHATSPYITIYKIDRSTDTFTKLSNPSSNPSNLPAGQGNGVSFSPDGQYMSVAHNSSPYITIYIASAGKANLIVRGGSIIEGKLIVNEIGGAGLNGLSVTSDLSVWGNVRIGMNTATDSLLILDSKTTAGDPAGVNGAMYYNASTNKFRCYEGGTWKDCLGAGLGGGGTGDVNQGGNNFGELMVLGTTDDFGLSLSTNNVARLTFDTAGNAYFGNGVTSLTPADFAIQGTGGSGTNTDGGDITIAGGRGTGNGTGGSIIFQTSASGSSGSTLRDLATVFSLQGGTGAATFQNTDDTTTALRILSANSDVLFAANTTNNIVRVGNSTGTDNDTTLFMVDKSTTERVAMENPSLNFENFSASRVSELTEASATNWQPVTGASPASGTTGSTNGWIDADNLTPGVEYLIMAWGQHNNSDNNGRSGIRVSHGGTPFTESQTIEESDMTGSAQKKSYFWFTVWEAVAGEDLTMDFFRASGTARVSNLQLVAIEADELLASEDLIYDIQTSGGSLTTTYTTKSSIQWTPASEGDTWWTMGYVQSDTDDTDVFHRGRLQIDGVTRANYQVEGEDSNDTPISGIGWVNSYDTSTHTANVQISESGSDQLWDSAGVFALRMNRFETFAVYAEAGDGTPLTSDGVFVEQAGVTQNVITGGNSIVAAGGIVDGNSGNVECRLQSNDSSNIFDIFRGWNHDPNDEVAVNAGSMQTGLTAGSYDYDFDCARTASNQAEVFDRWMVAFSMKESPPSEADSSGAIYYNTSMNKFRCHEGGVWKDCISASSASGDINNGGNSFGGAITLGTNDGNSLIFETNGTARMAINSNGDITIGASDTTGNVLTLDTKTNAGDPTGSAGSMYFNSNLGKFRCHNGSGWNDCGTGLLFANTSVPGGNTVSNTGTETNFSSNYVIPANDCTPGKVYRIRASGVYSTTTTNNELTMRVKMGNTTIRSTANLSAGNSMADRMWSIDFWITCFTSGSSGTVEGRGTFSRATTTNDMEFWEMSGTGTTTINTTNNQTLQISADWGTGSSSRTITLRQLVVETL